ncbi:MAG: MATE family efflux transporter [Clostridia bacterium]|nr:MATE family efflux transporter [Clostridia bacterium]
MTEGSIAKHIVNFAIPLILGNLFQQFYNMVDTWVVGNYVSDNAFSAVGTVAPIMNMFIFGFMGFATGAGIVVSQYFGARDSASVKRTVHTTAFMTLGFCVILSVFGYLFVPTMLRFMKSPAGVFEEQEAYLHIIFAFMSFQIIYNMTSAILRAIGDSTRPFIFLVISCLINIVLDLLFVLKLNLGVRGVAYATIVAQGVSAILCVYVMCTTDTDIKLSLGDMKYDFRISKQIVGIAVPTALQQCITGFSNIFVQGYVNVFGTHVMGGWTVYNKVDQIVMLPQQSMGMSVSTFVGQNLGAGNEKRAKKGMYTGMVIALGVSAVIASIVMIFARPVSYFFNQTPEIIHYGEYFLHLITPFMLVGCVNFVMISGLRGSGNGTVPMIVNLTCYVFLRQLYLFTVSHIWPGVLLPVSLAYPMGWMVCTIIVVIYYRKVGFGVKGSIAQQKR